jgi:lipopolysaccharide export system protein LptC
MKLVPAWLANLWSAAVLYLPLALMALLALGTYWLYRNTPGAPVVQAAPSASHDADYFMRGFSLRHFGPDGRVKSEIRGDYMRHFPDTDTLEIEAVRMKAPRDANYVTLATARKAISNADGSEVQLLGQARVRREVQSGAKVADAQPMAFEGEFLHVFAQTERVKSHLPVVVIRGNDRIESANLDFSYLDRNATFSGRVTARFDGKPQTSARP